MILSSKLNLFIMSFFNKYLKAVYVIVSLVAMFFSTTAFSSDKGQADKNWIQVSSGTATWMFFDVYNARLFAQSESLPQDFLSDAEPLKLELCYLKAISTDIFIEGANKVLPKTLTATLQNEVNRLHQSYQPVEPEDCYVLEYTPQLGTQLKLNNQTVFSSQVEGFKAVYFGVWLGENPLSESLKSSLLVPLISSHIVR